MAIPSAKPKGKTTIVNSVSDQSVQSLIKPSHTAMVYGFQHCQYSQVSEGLRKKIKRVYDCSLGNDHDPIPRGQREMHKRLCGTRIHKINSGITQLRKKGQKFETQDCNRKCKAGLVNLVIDNYKRSKLDRNLTPIIFCIDIVDNPHPLTSENLLSKTKTVGVGVAAREMNRIVTHSELRRAHKLCEDSRVDPKIRAIANRTFKFVKVTPTRTERDIEKPDRIDREISVDLSLTKVDAPWRKADFAGELAKRKALSVRPVQQKTPNWRAQVNQSCKERPPVGRKGKRKKPPSFSRNVKKFKS